MSRFPKLSRFSRWPKTRKKKYDALVADLNLMPKYTFHLIFLFFAIHSHKFTYTLHNMLYINSLKKKGKNVSFFCAALNKLFHITYVYI